MEKVQEMQANIGEDVQQLSKITSEKLLEISDASNQKKNLKSRWTMKKKIMNGQQGKAF